MNNKILNGIIVTLLFCCLFVGGKIMYSNYMAECEEYNDNIISSAIDLMNGKLSLDSIDNLTIPDGVKESFKNYYNETFYSDEDLILIYENVDNINRDIKAAQRVYKELTENSRIYFNNKVFEPVMLEDFLYTEIDVLFYESSFTSDELSELAAVQSILVNSDITNIDFSKDSRVIEKNGNLYIKVFDFYNTDAINYLGVKIDLTGVGLEKVLKNDMLSIQLNIEGEKELNKGEFIYIIRDEANNIYDLKVEKKLGKINSLTFS